MDFVRILYVVIFVEESDLIWSRHYLVAIIAKFAQFHIFPLLTKILKFLRSISRYLIQDHIVIKGSFAYNE